MNRKASKIAAFGALIASIMPNHAQAQNFTRGYTAVQVGATPTQLSERVNEATVRTYLNGAIEGEHVALRGQSLNEWRSNGYNFGRDSVRLDPKGSPVQPIITHRYLNGKTLDSAIGARILIPKNRVVDYGNVDVLKHLGFGTQNYTGAEITSFVGKKLGDWTLENTMTYKPQLEIGAGPKLFVEGELLAPAVHDGKRFEVRPYGRAEHYSGLGNTLTGGMQFRLKHK